MHPKSKFSPSITGLAWDHPREAAAFGVRVRARRLNCTTMKPTNGIIMKPLLRLPRRSFSTTKVFKGPIDKAFRGVNYGFRLEHESISCLESVVTSRHDFGDKVRTFEGSLLVGADGIFSAGRANHFTQILTNCTSCCQTHA